MEVEISREELSLWKLLAKMVSSVTNSLTIHYIQFDKEHLVARQNTARLKMI